MASSVGFGQVVVGARLESLQDILGPAARRQHQHRHELPGFAQLADDGEAILARQHDVEDDQVERRRRLAEQPRQRRLAGLDDGGDVALRLEVEAQALGEVLLVLDDEDAVPRVVAGRRRAPGSRFGRLRQEERERAAVALAAALRERPAAVLCAPPTAR